MFSYFCFSMQTKKTYSAYLLIGSNEGNRLQFLTTAKEQIEQFAGRIILTSSIYQTDAWGKENLPPHLNQALLIRTGLEPLELLNRLQQIETNLGRKKTEKWGIRKIDIDIIYFDNLIINHPQLQIPHPLMQNRRFVLSPLTEIAPNFLHPVLQKTNQELLQTLSDPLKVTRFITSPTT